MRESRRQTARYGRSSTKSITMRRRRQCCSMSPGGMTEKIACFVAPYAAGDRLGLGGGVDADESIELVEMAYDDAFAAIGSGGIRDAKTIALLYYAKATGLL